MPVVRGGGAGGGALGNGITVRQTGAIPNPLCAPPSRLYTSGFPPLALVIIDHVGTTVTYQGDGAFWIEKTGGTDGVYDAGAVSVVGADGDFALRLKKLNTTGANAYGGGVNSDPLTNASYTSIDNLWLWIVGGANLWTVYENGTNMTGNFADSTYAWIWRTGGTLYYGRGATLTAAEAAPDRSVASSGTVYFDSTLYSTGDKIEAKFFKLGPNIVTNGDGTTTTGWVDYYGASGAISATGGRIRIAGTGGPSGYYSNYTTEIGKTYLLQGTMFPHELSRARIGVDGGVVQYDDVEGDYFALQFTATSTSVAVYISAGGNAAWVSSGEYAEFDDIRLREVNPSFSSTAYSMPAAVGTFSYSGQPANLPVGYVMAGGAGVFSYTGQAALLERGYPMTAGLGTFSYTGQAALLERGYNMAASQGTFSYSGQPANTVAALFMPAGVGIFSYTGQAAILERIFPMAAGVGTFNYNGQSALLERGYPMVAGLGTFSYAGQDAILTAYFAPVAYSMPAGLGTFSYTGQPARAILSLDAFPPSSGAGGGSGVKVAAFFYR